MFHRVGLLGAGLMGGSFGLAVRKHAPSARVTGWDREAVLARAMERGAIQESAPSLAAAVRDADLVYVALPVGATLELLPQIAQHARADALVTDACSVKQPVCRAAASCFAGGRARFLGGHPLTGREQGGIENATAELFVGTRYALIAGPQETDPRVLQFTALVECLGARPAWLEAETHDWAVAIISHLPQLAAVALAAVAREETDETGLPLELAGPGLRDSLRLAGSRYESWRDICMTNAENIGPALDRLIQALDHLRANLKTRELQHQFEEANEVYKLLRGME
jgi:prephenate dehydrogenase